MLGGKPERRDGARPVARRGAHVDHHGSAIPVGQRLCEGDCWNKGGEQEMETLVNATVGYIHPSGLEALVEAVHVGSQFGDDLNTVVSSADGQRGLLPAHTVWNAAVNYRVEWLRSTVFVAVKNLTDRTFLADRARGMIPGSPRLVHVGLRLSL